MGQPGTCELWMWENRCAGILILSTGVGGWVVTWHVCMPHALCTTPLHKWPDQPGSSSYAWVGQGVDAPVAMSHQTGMSCRDTSSSWSEVDFHSCWSCSLVAYSMASLAQVSSPVEAGRTTLHQLAADSKRQPLCSLHLLRSDL